jgi:drug/metabolite transporter (DMT)-like permease
MDTIHILAALCSALLHAGWNASIKASRQPAEAMAAQMILSAVMSLPIIMWFGLPPLQAWLWILAATLTNTVIVTTLLRAYALGGFGIVYPVTRAVSVLMVVPLAAALTGERITIPAMLGVALIVASLGMLSSTATRATAHETGHDQTFSKRALMWTCVSGVATAVYVMCDASGVRASGSPWTYGCTMAITNAAAMAWRQRHVGSPLVIVRKHWHVGLPAATAAMASYLAILWVWSVAPVAPAAALRDTSAIFAILIAVIWLREPLTRSRIGAVLLAALAVPLLRWA